MNRREAIKKRCLNCSAGDRAEVKNCGHNDCPLYPFRTGSGHQNPKTRDRAIKAYCAWCSNSRAEVAHCTVTDCPLFPYRKSTLDHSTGTHDLPPENITGEQNLNLEPPGQYKPLAPGEPIHD